MPKRPQPAKKTATRKKPLKASVKRKTTKITAVKAAPKPAIIPPPKGFKRLDYKIWRQNRATYIARRPRLPSVWHTTKLTAQLLWQYKGVIAGVVVVYGLLNLLLVQGFANANDISNLKSELSKSFHGNFNGLTLSATGLVLLGSSSSNSSGGSGDTYQVFLVLLVSLALIWTFRQVLAGAVVHIREAYYKGVYPLVPFILVLLTIGLQLLPLLLGAALYNTVMTNGIAATSIEKIFWAAVLAGSALLTLFWISSSIFALYIVTLPDMTPMKALRSARELVRYRRWTLLLKILYLPLLLLIAVSIIMIPIVLLVTPLTAWVFFVLTMFAIAIVHGYMYTLYRELLND